MYDIYFQWSQKVFQEFLANKNYFKYDNFSRFLNYTMISAYMLTGTSVCRWQREGNILAFEMKNAKGSFCQASSWEIQVISEPWQSPINIKWDDRFLTLGTSFYIQKVIIDDYVVNGICTHSKIGEWTTWNLT